jgi:hypothetical protein
MQLFRNESLAIPMTEFDSDDDISSLPVKVGDKLDY